MNDLITLYVDFCPAAITEEEIWMTFQEAKIGNIKMIEVVRTENPCILPINEQVMMDDYQGTYWNQLLVYIENCNNIKKRYFVKVSGSTYNLECMLTKKSMVVYRSTDEISENYRILYPLKSTIRILNGCPREAHCFDRKIIPFIVCFSNMEYDTLKRYWPSRYNDTKILNDYARIYNKYKVTIKTSLEGWTNY